MAKITQVRYLFDQISSDVENKVILLGGPRQVGKTTLAQNVFSLDKDSPAYLNWDVLKSRKILMKEEWPPDASKMIFDEIHKYAKWRNLVKGFYDQEYPKKKLIVTGSARLDHYKKGGDSMLGRYYHFRLHPFSLGELAKNPNENDLNLLLNFGGFPEPLLAQSEIKRARWVQQRHQLLLREDIRDLEQVKDLSLLELLLEALPERVGSPLSVNNLAEDLGVAQYTVKRWIQIFQNVYLVFLISPYGAPKIKAVKKEQKLYFWDWATVPDSGARFENLVASQLLKYCHYQEDVLGKKMELRFIRTTEKKEIDFVVLENSKPVFAVESKSGERALSPHIQYFKNRLKVPKYYQVHRGSKDYALEKESIRVLPFVKFVREIQAP